MKKIYRDLDHKMIAGICAGIGETLDFDPTIVRLIFVFCAAATAFFPLIAAYAVGWFIIPPKSNTESSGSSA
jgi:phage shock protein C